MNKLQLLSLFALVIPLAAAGQAHQPFVVKFDFGKDTAHPGYTHVAPTDLYADAKGYGFEGGADVAVGDHGQTVTSDQPFYFSAKVPEGNYTVKIAFGDSAVETVTTVKAEAGRLMLERILTIAGQTMVRSFSTNVRTPKLPALPLNATGREAVSLDMFDGDNLRDWDDRLTLEIVSPHAALRSIEIAAAPELPTVFLAGDSTVTDRNGGDIVSWGQLLPRFLNSGVVVANEAQSGETLKSFANALRLDKILSQMKPGDYLFLQFTHNDSKADWPQTYVEPETTFKAWLKVYIAEVRRRGATTVLIASMDRSDRKTGAPLHSHGLYPRALHEVAKEEHVPLIDLYAMSTVFYNAAGTDAPLILADGTHSTVYGGYEFAKCILVGIRQNHLDLARFILNDFTGFDPAQPDSSTGLNLAPLFTGLPGKRATPTPADLRGSK